MINANFDALNHSAAVNGVYQYDTGQRLCIHGMPSPEEIAESDDFLSGYIATVQVHFGRRGDSQTEARLAQWDEDRGCWVTAVPDSYLQAAENVYVYVYVSYGVDEDGNGRTKTMYELTFRPISRPAPNNVATNEQWEAWATKKNELDLALDALEAASANLEGAADAAQEAAENASAAVPVAAEAAQIAQEVIDRLADIDALWSNLTIRTTSLAPGSEGTATMDDDVLTLGLPQGAPGEKGEPGDIGPADISLSFSDGILTITPK